MRFLKVPPPWNEEIPLMCVLDSGRVLCIRRFIYTWGLHVDVKFDGGFIDFSARYCYERIDGATAALLTWDGNGDPPGMWVKEKVSERLGPGALNE